MSRCLACRQREAAPDALQCPTCRTGAAPPPEAVPARDRKPSAKCVRSEAEIQADVVAWLRLNGWDVTVTSAHRHAKGVTSGTPDLYVRLPYNHGYRGIGREPGCRVWIEMKRPGGKVTPAQKLWHEQEQAAGGRVIVAYSLDDVRRELAA